MKERVKPCYKCRKVLPVTSFFKRPDSKDGYRSHCKECCKGWKRDKSKSTLYRKNWISKHPLQYKGIQKNWKKKRKIETPWCRCYDNIISRCGKNGIYGKKGIKNFLTQKDLKKLWFRDKAYLLKKYSIDRINPKKHYTFKNCRFIELSENCREGGRNRWKTIKKNTSN